MTSDSLLAHLAWRFPGATEDIATEALCYILRKQEGARTALADLLRSGGANPEPMDSFDTQRVYQRSKKPDLVAFNGDKEVLLVESKFWAWLTPNQPNGYLRLMMDDLPDARNLLFIAPEASQGWLWDELCRRAKNFNLTGKRTGGGVQSTVVGSGGHRMMLTTWDSLLERIALSGADEDGDLRQLVGLCAQMDDDAPRPSGNAEELSEVSHYEDLIRSAVQQARERGYIDTKGLGSARWQSSYGRYIWFVNAEGDHLGTARIGIDFDRSESPLFLWFTDNYKYFSPERMDQIRTQVGKDLEPGDQLSIPVSPDPAYANVLADVVGRLKEIRDRIAV
ncbi:MAG: hypothetical protein OXL97_10385 [Chloroflexota bacterium]|nr:hypothetical protein [Chloroflexota bacterium]MDE2886186.1 hypothetical protein [Chloroflexota bacterium]